MIYAIDLDGTIANPSTAFIAWHNKEFDLGLTAEEARFSYKRFLRLPQVAKLSSEDLERSRQRARMQPEMLLSYAEFDLASHAVRLLAEHGKVAYYTVRAPDMLSVTEAWLQHHGFPFSQNVVLCRSVLNKLVQLYQHERDADMVVLIDDRYQQMINDFALLAGGAFPQLSEWQEIVQFVQQRVQLVAFGAAYLPAIANGLQVTPLPNWKHVADKNLVTLFLESLRKES